MGKPFDMTEISEWVNDGSCSGEDCQGCESDTCYSKGGRVREEGVHEQDHGAPKGQSYMGTQVRRGNIKVGPDSDPGMSSAVSHSEKNLKKMKSLPRPKLYSKGGKIDLKKKLMSDDENTNSSPIYSTQSASMGPDPYRPASGYGHEWTHNPSGGYSMSDYSDPEYGKKKPGYAEGGEIDEAPAPEDEELANAASQELLDSIEKKDKAGILEAIRAIVLSVR